MSCCSKPEVRIIRVADFEAGLRGLDEALLQVFLSGEEDEGKVAAALLDRLRRAGNYISSSREEAYRVALLREYRAFAKESCSG